MSSLGIYLIVHVPSHGTLSKGNRNTESCSIVCKTRKQHAKASTTTIWGDPGLFRNTLTAQ